MRRIFILAAALAFSATTALAHITVSPTQSKPAARETYTFNVPTEGASPTTGVELEVPQGVEVVSVEAEPSTYTLTKKDGRTVAIRWTVSIPPREARKLVLVAQKACHCEREQSNRFSLSDKLDNVKSPNFCT